VLRFHYKDADKLPKICDDILEEIKEACASTIILQGRPFRAHWTSYESDHLKVVVNTHHNLKPIGKKRMDAQMQVLLCIHRAVKKNNVEFVTTWYPPHAPQQSTVGVKKK
jgi:hypothetical protein